MKTHFEVNELLTNILGYWINIRGFNIQVGKGINPHFVSRQWSQWQYMIYSIIYMCLSFRVLWVVDICDNTGMHVYGSKTIWTIVPQMLSILSLTWPGAQQADNASRPMGHKDPSVPVSPALGLQGYNTTLGIL